MVQGAMVQDARGSKVMYSKGTPAHGGRKGNSWQLWCSGYCIQNAIYGLRASTKYLIRIHCQINITIWTIKFHNMTQETKPCYFVLCSIMLFWAGTLMKVAPCEGERTFETGLLMTWWEEWTV